MTKFRIENVPGYGTLTDDGRRCLLAIAKYAEVYSGYYAVSVLDRLTMIKNIVQTCAEKGVMYAEDFCPDREKSRGGVITGLCRHRIIKHTGNWRVLENGMERWNVRSTTLRVNKEWTLAVSYEDFTAAYELYKAHLVSTIQNQL